jgi:hypothetical protein
MLSNMPKEMSKPEIFHKKYSLKVCFYTIPLSLKGTREIYISAIMGLPFKA